MCKSKEENKEAGNTEKTLNLSLYFDPCWHILSYDTINGKIIETDLYPVSINIINDSIIVLNRLELDKDEEFISKEYRNKLTDRQYLKIKEIVSALKKYDNSNQRNPSDSWKCILEIDSQIYYKYKICDKFPFSYPGWPPMPEEIEFLFKYITNLFPISLMPDITFFDLELIDYHKKQICPKGICP